MSVSFDYKKKLGEGHFGEVWLVVETGLNFTCAVKRIPIGKILNADNYFHEAQVLKEAEHPNIIRVFDTGYLSDSEVYMTMEYLEKGSLLDEAQGAYLTLSRARNIMIDVLRGLEYSHSKGIIHRDIKPANILVGKCGEGILSDFGLALPNMKSLNTASLKDYEYLLHLAPEVGDVFSQNILSDIYACGITLYRLVNGDIYLPKVSPGEAHALAKRGKFPDRSKYREFVPRPVKALINKAMDIDPIKRFQNAAEFRRVLEQTATGVDWNEIRLSRGFRWIGNKKGIIYEIVRSEDPRTSVVNVVTKKGRSDSNLKKITRLTTSLKTLEKAKAFTKNVFKEISKE